ncbi:MAG TPA: 7TM diverse intracellular signaling domain-containing protein [Pseudoxanthomonas sp.]
MIRHLRWCLLLCALWLGAAAAQAPASLTIDRAEAVRSEWNAAEPPGTGWTPVKLMDYWDARWPNHDGVVWYRLHWRQDAADRPTALLVDYLCMTGAVYVNGSLIGRDPSLTEPLSRTWNSPQYYLLSEPLLREGENTLLVRVSGLAAYQPGFGTVSVGDPAVVHAQYRSDRFRRYDIKLINLAMSVVLGGVFLLIWLLRRQDTVYGWFALSELTGSLYGANFIATSPWPFPSTDAWQAFIAAMYMAAGASYAMFLLRYGERRFPRLERAMGALALLGLIVALLAPGWMGPHRTPWILLGGAFFYLSIGWFLIRAWRVRRVDYVVMAACVLAPVLVSFYDFALYFGWVRGDTYLLSLTSVLTLIGVGFVLAYRFVTAMRRVEGFNAELQREVTVATDELADTLNRQHGLELAHSRAGERLQLVRDLHDGFGGTLVGAIARLEQAPADTPKAQVIDVLKEMRDDLRLVIDSTAQEQADLALLLAPLRHRASRLLETADIDAHWHVDGLDGVQLEPARSLDLLRLLQEALTNVFKHSRARRVEVAVIQRDGHLQVRVQDDGVGLHAASDVGAGLASLRVRALRLGGALQIETPLGGGTRLSLEIALA